MIPRGRPTLDLAGVAERAGVSLATWRRRHHPAFTAAVHPLPGSERPVIYDAAQVDAHLAGQPVPRLAALIAIESGEHQAAEPAAVAAESATFGGDQAEPASAEEILPHPSDLLTDKEAGAVAGVSPSTIRADAATSRMDPGVERHGRRWWTREAAEERAQRERQYRGRTVGSKDKGTRAKPDHRAAEVAAELHRADAGRRTAVTAAEIAEFYDVSERTAERIIANAKKASPSA